MRTTAQLMFSDFLRWLSIVATFKHVFHQTYVSPTFRAGQVEGASENVACSYAERRCGSQADVWHTSCLFDGFFGRLLSFAANVRLSESHSGRELDGSLKNRHGSGLSLRGPCTHWVCLKGKQLEPEKPPGAVHVR